MVEIPPGRIPSGIPEIDYQIAKRLANTLPVTVISPFYSRFRKEQYEGNLQIRYVRHPALNRSSKTTTFRLMVETFAILNYSLLSLFEILNETKSKSDVVIFSDKLSGLLPAFVARFLGRRIIFSEGNTFPWYIPASFKPSSLSKCFNISIGILACRLSGTVRAQSQLIKQGMILAGVNTNIEVISSGVDTAFFSPAKKMQQDSQTFRVGFVGRLTPEKGVSLFLTLLKEAQRELPHLVFVIAGSGNYERDMRNLKNIEFWGQIPLRKVKDLINSCDVMVFFQIEFGLAELESLSCGKPIITLYSFNNATMLKDGEGLLCKTSSDYLHSLAFLQNNSKILEVMGEKARKLALQKYSWDVILEEWMSIIRPGSF